MVIEKIKNIEIVVDGLGNDGEIHKMIMLYNGIRESSIKNEYNGTHKLNLEFEFEEGKIWIE